MQTIREAILIACSTAKGVDLAAQSLAKVELPRSDKDLCSALVKGYGSREQWDMAICLFEEVMFEDVARPKSRRASHESCTTFQPELTSWQASLSAIE